MIYGEFDNKQVVINGEAADNPLDYTFYVNGVSLGSQVDADNATVGATSTIGNNNNTSYFNGKIDEVAVFNTALTAHEVQGIYNATETGKTADLNDLTTPPVAWYRMGD